MKKSIYAVAAALVLFAGQAFSDTFNIATGDSKGGSTYSQMFREYLELCGNVLPMVEVETTGSVKNVELLVANSVNAAFLQSDLLAFRRLTDEASVANIRTLFALHPEELHFVARADVKKEGGFMGIGSQSVSYNVISDLAGRPVGAVGGSVLSGRVVASQSGINFQVVEFENNQALLEALLSGKVDSILVVGGAPHKLVKALDQRYKILSVPADVQKKLAGVYSSAKVSYGNLNQAGVDTVSTEALFVTRTYRSPDMQRNLSELRQCFIDKLPTIQDKRGTHAKWQVVDSANTGKWVWYDLK